MSSLKPTYLAAISFLFHYFLFEFCLIQFVIPLLHVPHAFMSSVSLLSQCLIFLFSSVYSFVGPAWSVLLLSCLMVQADTPFSI